MTVRPQLEVWAPPALYVDLPHTRLDDLGPQAAILQHVMNESECLPLPFTILYYSIYHALRVSQLYYFKSINKVQHKTQYLKNGSLRLLPS